MYHGKLIFAQAIDHLPHHTLRRCIQRYHGNHHVKRFSCQDQYRCMAFAQLTYRESLRDIEACLRAQSGKLYHMGLRSTVSRSTLADANEQHDWRIYADFAQSLIHTARRLCLNDHFGVELDNTVYALDATTIDLCLSVFPRAHFRRTKAAVKLHTLLDLRGAIPTFIHVSPGKLHDVKALDTLLPEPGVFYIMDRACLDFERLHRLTLAPACFVIRAKSNLKFRRLYSHQVDKTTGLRCDQTGVLAGRQTAQRYPDTLRRIKYHDANTGKKPVFLTNNFTLPARTITELYQCRWQVELFFKWLKQHLRIQSFFGASGNAVKTQIRIAVSICVLVAIIKKRLNCGSSLYTILQILSVTLFERIPLYQLLGDCETDMNYDPFSNQLNLFD
jgi:IS4 transposase